MVYNYHEIISIKHISISSILKKHICWAILSYINNCNSYQHKTALIPLKLRLISRHWNVNELYNLLISVKMIIINLRLT